MSAPTPADRMKAKREHRIPLSGRALEILEEARKLHACWTGGARSCRRGPRISLASVETRSPNRSAEALARDSAPSIPQRPRLRRKFAGASVTVNASSRSARKLIPMSSLNATRKWMPPVSSTSTLSQFTGSSGGVYDVGPANLTVTRTVSPAVHAAPLGVRTSTCITRVIVYLEAASPPSSVRIVAPRSSMPLSATTTPRAPSSAAPTV